ncbi:chaperone [Coemansia sp. RSA 2711]|nr:chaperone [Coemansia sp. RSA 2711]KAJ2357203.1 chaperone [Coemansia sp. RSA 2610]KAJ2360326.1 chaperone [Coemansia sp. RSA 2611]
MLLQRGGRAFGAALRCMPRTRAVQLPAAGNWQLRLLGTSHAARDAPTAAGDTAARKPPAVRRFWRHASVGEQDGDLVIRLDARAIKTPDGRLVRIPAAQRTLAWLVAGEWESQKEFLGPHSLPLTSLVSRAIDGLSEPAARADVIAKLLKYFHTDSVCLHDEHPRALVALQQQHYAPLVAWARAAYGIDVATTTDMFALRQAPAATDALRAAVGKFSPLKLAALERAVMAAKSFLIGLALVEQRISAEDAAQAALVEATAQTQLWGELENAHDLDNAAMRQILGASACAAMDA